jgi:chlorophyllide a reductase subunit Y
MSEVSYDKAHQAPLTEIASVDLPEPQGAAPVDGMGCHAGAETMQAAARRLAWVPSRGTPER